MKRKTAIKNAKAISDRVLRLGGIIGTPECDYTSVRVNRIWVFGSTAKGSESPNDLDILVDMCRCGNRQVLDTRRMKGFGQAKRDRNVFPKGSHAPLYSIREAKKFLRRGMKMVSIHDVDVDGDFGDIRETKIMIYPRFDLR